MPFTPAYVAPPQKEKPLYRFSWVRVLVISVLLFLLLAVCLYLNQTAFKALKQGLTDGEHKNSAWIAGEIGSLLPLITVAVFQFAIYHKHDRHDGIVQKEMAWEILLSTLLTYTVLLPIVIYLSDAQLAEQLAQGVDVPQNDGGEYITLFLNSLTWFLHLGVTMLLLWLFHSSKANSEMTAVQEESAQPLSHGDISAQEGEEMAQDTPDTTPPQG